jgi:large subunit ribosomal protein L32
VGNPKRKVSKSRRDMRAAHFKLVRPNISLCPHCHHPRRPHHVCLNCGYYGGHQAIAVAAEEEE